MWQGSAEFLGRTKAYPMVKLDPTDGRTPVLQWYTIKKGAQYGGELLAAFELFQVSISSGQCLQYLVKLHMAVYYSGIFAPSPHDCPQDAVMVHFWCIRAVFRGFSKFAHFAVACNKIYALAFMDLTEFVTCLISFAGVVKINIFGASYIIRREIMLTFIFYCS